MIYGQDDLVDTSDEEYKEGGSQEKVTKTE